MFRGFSWFCAILCPIYFWFLSKNGYGGVPQFCFYCQYVFCWCICDYYVFSYFICCSLLGTLLLCVGFGSASGHFYSSDCVVCLLQSYSFQLFSVAICIFHVVASSLMALVLSGILYALPSLDCVISPCWSIYVLE